MLSSSEGVHQRSKLIRRSDRQFAARTRLSSGPIFANKLFKSIDTRVSTAGYHQYDKYIEKKDYNYRKQSFASPDDKASLNKKKLISQNTIVTQSQRYDEDVDNTDSGEIITSAIKIPNLKKNSAKRIKVLNHQTTDNPSLFRAITNKSLASANAQENDFGQNLSEENQKDKRFGYKNKFLSSSYHLVSHKRNRADSFEIIPSSVPSHHNNKQLVAFYKMRKRELHPKVQLTKTEGFSNGSCYWNALLQKHVPYPHISKMASRDVDKYLTNTVYCQNDYDANKEYGMNKLNIGNISFQNQMNRNRSMEVNFYFADSKILK